MPSIDTARAQEPAAVTEAQKVPKIAESAVPDARSAVADQSPVNDEAAAETSVEAVDNEVKDSSVAAVVAVEEVVDEKDVAKSDDAEEPEEATDPEMVAIYAEFNALKRKMGKPRGPPSRPNQSSSDKRRKLDDTGRKSSTTSSSTKTAPSSSTSGAGGSSKSKTKTSNQSGDAKAAKKK